MREKLNFPSSEHTPAATHLLEDLPQQREEPKALLLERHIIAALPHGVHLISYQPKEPPIVLTQSSVVNDSVEFTESTLRQLGQPLAAPQGCFFCRGLNGGESERRSLTPEEIRAHFQHSFLAGNWSLKDLLELLEQVGLVVEVDQ